MSKIFKVLFEGKSGFWTALSTVIMCIFTGFLYEVSKRANELNAVGQRAMVNSSGPIWSRITTPDKKLAGYRVTYAWSNSGHNPAKNAVAEYNMSLGDARPDAGTNFDSLPQTQRLSFIIGPSGGIQLPDVNLSVRDMDDVVQKRKHLFLWGWITYDDGLPDSPKRLTEFCADMASVTWNLLDLTDPLEDITWSAPPCGVHNCYDEQCSDYSLRTK